MIRFDYRKYHILLKQEIADFVVILLILYTY